MKLVVCNDRELSVPCRHSGPIKRERLRCSRTTRRRAISSATWQRCSNAAEKAHDRKFQNLGAISEGGERFSWPPFLAGNFPVPVAEHPGVSLPAMRPRPGVGMAGNRPAGRLAASRSSSSAQPIVGRREPLWRCPINAPIGVGGGHIVRPRMAGSICFPVR